MEASEALIEQYRPLILSIARRYEWQGHRAGHDLEDLIDEGMIGLLKAAARFNPGRRVKFSTYAYPRIEGSILDLFRYNNGLVNVPRQCWEDGDRAVFLPLLKREYSAEPPDLDGMIFRDALLQLTPLQRAAIQLHILDGISFATLARESGRSDMAILNLVRRGLARLRRRLAPLGYG